MLLLRVYEEFFLGSKTTGMINLVRQLKNAGVPIQGVGLQAHFIVGSLPGNLASVMQQYAALGVEVRHLLWSWTPDN